ncbi:MAG: hypothetical protein KKB34_10220 [Bacteroidetes bacterium]|nr:hypothetical protein [Bacteroidota bacterium]
MWNWLKKTYTSYNKKRLTKLALKLTTKVFPKHTVAHIASKMLYEIVIDNEQTAPVILPGGLAEKKE